MTAEAIEDVRSPTRRRDWTWADLHEIPGPHQLAAGRIRDLLLAAARYRAVRTVRAGETGVVDVPFRVELRPAELAGPRTRS